MTHFRFGFNLCLALLVLLIMGCEGGLEPPLEDPEPVGVIIGTVTYSGEWPPEDELRLLFFVPLPFIPNQFSDILLEIDNLRTSDELKRNVDEDTFIVDEVLNGAYVYNIIANQFGPQILLDWRPLGVYTENDGVIIVEGDTTEISIHVDFNQLPPFPPEP